MMALLALEFVNRHSFKDLRLIRFHSGSVPKKRFGTQTLSLKGMALKGALPCRQRPVPHPGLHRPGFTLVSSLLPAR